MSDDLKRTNFWRSPETEANAARLPGRVMKQITPPSSASPLTTQYSFQTQRGVNQATHQIITPVQQQQQQHLQHRRNNSTSFELFTASCDDAWDSHVDDCLTHEHQMKNIGKRSSSMNRSKNNSNNNNNSSKHYSATSASITSIGKNFSMPLTIPNFVKGKGYLSTSVPQSSSTSSSYASNKPITTTSTATLTKIDVNQTTPSRASDCSNKHSSHQHHRYHNNNNNNSNTTPTTTTTTNEMSKSDTRLAKFKQLIFENETTDLNQLRSMSWAGIPPQIRSTVWKLLLGYLPVVKARREQIITRKRQEYRHLVHQYYNNRSSNDEMWRQIHIDIPRMQPLISIFQQDIVQRIFERILYIWSIRHPASGYVQGMNDLVTPFFVVYLTEYVPEHCLKDIETFEVSSLSDEVLSFIEADTFWSFTKLLDSIQDNYTFAQPGIQCLVNLLSRVMKRADSTLHEHLTKHNVQYLQFAFRWMNNLLIRELPLHCIIRLWDTYLSEGAVASTSTPTTTASNKSTAGEANNANTKTADSNSSTSQQQQQQTTGTTTMVIHTLKDENGQSDIIVPNLGDGTPFASSFHLFVCAAFLRYFSKMLLREKDFQGLMLLLQNLPTFHWTDSDIMLLVADAYQLKYTFTPNHLLS